METENSFYFWLFIKRLSKPKECERCIARCLQGVPSLSNVPVQNKAVQHVKRKLQFIPVNRYVIGPKWFCLHSE